MITKTQEQKLSRWCRLQQTHMRFKLNQNRWDDVLRCWKERKKQRHWLHCLACVSAGYDSRHGDVAIKNQPRNAVQLGSANVLENQWSRSVDSRAKDKYPAMLRSAKRFFGCKLPVHCSKKPTDYCALLIMRDVLETWRRGDGWELSQTAVPKEEWRQLLWFNVEFQMSTL